MIENKLSGILYHKAGMQVRQANRYVTATFGNLNLSNANHVTPDNLIKHTNAIKQSATFFAITLFFHSLSPL